MVSNPNSSPDSATPIFELRSLLKKDISSHINDLYSFENRGH
ncbi:hypothetical protein RintRC_5271 [Richelia intracellularis]|nr:hypothetical protein RintRC_5271 [Richelia intracellularis]